MLCYSQEKIAYRSYILSKTKRACFGKPFLLLIITASSSSFHSHQSVYDDPSVAIAKELF